MKGRVFKAFRLHFFVAAFFCLSGVSIATAQEASQLSVELVEKTESMMVVEVQAKNIKDLYGFDLRLNYDPAVVAVQDIDLNNNGIQIEPGNFLPASQRLIALNRVDETNGEIALAITLLNPASPVNGNGSLARIRLFVTQPDTPSTITIKRVELIAANLENIPVAVSAYEFGEIEVASSTQTITETETMTGSANPAEIIEADPTIEPIPDSEASAPSRQNLNSDVNSAAPDDIAKNFDRTDTTNVQMGLGIDTFPWWIVSLGIIVTGFIGLLAMVFMVKPARALSDSSPTKANWPIDSIPTKRS